MSYHYRNAGRHSDELLNIGYTHIASSEVAMPSDFQMSFEAMRECLNELVGDSPTRRRAYMQFIVMPGSDKVDLSLTSPFDLGSSYWQSSEHNAEAGGAVRHFAKLPSFARCSRALEELVAADLRLSMIRQVFPAAAHLPIVGGLHLIRMVATPGQPAVALPNRPHKDGEFFTFIHALDRDGVEGGETTIHSNGPDGTLGDLLFCAPLQTQLETVAVADWNVYHDVREVRVARHRTRGTRDSLLVDFTPLVPVFMGINGLPRVHLPSIRIPQVF